ncbi:MAG: hypothetical protein JNL08_16450 [Planctomycetes bacterium]|nr:hypothetical protein [Planctomycetota bacterium]
MQQLGLCGSALTLGSTIVPSPSANVQTAPSIDFAGGKYVLAWTEFVPGTGLRTFAKGLDPATCAACGAVLELEASSTPQDQPAVAARRSGGDTTSDEALVVWSNGSIRGRRFEAVGSDTVASMGGACGIAAFENYATYDGDAVLGNLDFELVLANPTLPVLALVIGLSPVSLGCGPCTLVPALDILVPFATQHPVPIPCDLSYLDVDFYAQWLLLAPGGCPLLPDFALSNALRFTIGE